MKSYFLAASAATLLLASAAQAQEGPPADGMMGGHMGGRMGGMMGGPPDFDLDHDGKVTLSEFKQVENQRIARMFARMDANHDGKISRDEMQAMGQRMAARRGGQGGPPDGGGGRGDIFFQMNDLNGDGVITRAEMEKAVERRFEAADTNHDGWLSKGELIMMRQRARGGGQ